MNITIVNSEAEFDRIAAWRIIGEILNNPKSIIGLSTGKTTINMHHIVGQIFKQFPFDISNITLFGVDEISNIPQEYKGSCYARLKAEIVDILGISEQNFIALPTCSDDYEKECELFQETLESRGGIDLQILGLGLNGHLGFNQPGTSFNSETWHSKMDEISEEKFRKEATIPMCKELGGLTLGIKNIMHARKIILAAKGSSKAEVVAKMLLGPISNDIPASILQLHPNCEFILDAEAAKYIQ